MTSEKTSLWGRLKKGLQKTSSSLTTSFKQILTHKKVDQQTIEDFEDLFISHDFGVEATQEILKDLKSLKFESITEYELKKHLVTTLESILKPQEKNLSFPKDQTSVLLVVGVNGTGKTTTVGKLGSSLHNKSISVSFCAADTFRAGSIEQLEEWGKRLGVNTYKSKPGGDPAGLCYDALNIAKKNSDEVLIIDTAGRLHNKAHLMDELQKITKVIQKVDPNAPHETILVIDATTGQNALNQVEVFHKVTPLTGLIITKLDSTAKAGIVVQITKKYAIPIIGIGIGEAETDLRPFDAKSFCESLLDFNEGEETT